MRTPLSRWFDEHPEVTQEHLAARLKITQGHVSRVASGVQRPGIDIIVALERETGIPHTAWVKRPAKSARGVHVP